MHFRFLKLSCTSCGRHSIFRFFSFPGLGTRLRFGLRAAQINALIQCSRQHMSVLHVLGGNHSEDGEYGEVSMHRPRGGGGGVRRRVRLPEVEHLGCIWLVVFISNFCPLCFWPITPGSLRCQRACGKRTRRDGRLRPSLLPEGRAHKL